MNVILNLHFQHCNGLAQEIRVHSTTTWIEFYPILTTNPRRVLFFFEKNYVSMSIELLEKKILWDIFKKVAF